MEWKSLKGTIHYHEVGEGIPIVILHSLATDQRSMKAWLEPFFIKSSQPFRRIYIDTPAHGGSKLEPWVKTTDDILSVILGFLDDILKDESYLVLGMSFGGYLAQGIMAKRADNIAGLCLLVPPTQNAKRNVPAKAELIIEDGIFEELDEEIVAAFRTLILKQTRESLDLFLKEWQPGRLLADREFLASDWREKGYHFSFEPFPEGTMYEQPALIVTGRLDYICGYKDPFKLVDHFTNGTFAVISKAGHLIQIEERNQVLALIENWLDEFQH